MSQIKFNEYNHSKNIENSKVEWLIEHGKVNETVFFKGATGDRYTIYPFVKRNKNIVDIYSIWNLWSHNTDEGNHIGTINKDYILCITDGKKWSWKDNAGDVFKQLKRQGVCPLGNKQYKIRWCRSAFFVRTHDGNEFTPWIGMKVNLKTGLLINKPTRLSKKAYNKAKETDKAQRKRNYIANRENTKALERYRKAGGNTSFETSQWIDGRRIEQIDPSLETMDWSLIPIDDVFRHRNATLRSNIIEHYGMNKILSTLNHEVVDEDTIDGRYYKLLDVVIPDFSDNSPGFDGTYKGLYLEMINPSTGESHFEGVPNVSEGQWGPRLKEATVKAALTWRDSDLSIQDKNNIMGDSNLGNTDDYITPVVLK